MKTMRRPNRWTPGNRFTLLENGEAFFPRVFEAIAAAQHEVMLETFILFDDKVGQGLHAALLQAAKRGVSVHVLVDGFGSPDLPPAFLDPLVEAGVHFRMFDPGQAILGQRINVLRRMHRKIVVVDGTIGFIGGINYSADHLADFGPEAKQDYSVEVRGPIVAQLHQFTHAVVASANAANANNATNAGHTQNRSKPADSKAATAPAKPAEAGPAQALFVTRDNHRHRNDIERHYRMALRAARQRVVIANAYFFPGYRLIREMRRAAKRGVDVRLVLQGQPDMPIVRTAAELLYDHLLRAGVRIYEYCDRPLHGKVALMDEEWSTVGSSNLDPLSLSLNLEANVVIRDRDFNQTLFERLQHLMENSCRQVEAPAPSRWDMLRVWRSVAVFHLMRWFPTWAGWLPKHAPSITKLGPTAQSQEPAQRFTPTV